MRNGRNELHPLVFVWFLMKFVAVIFVATVVSAAPKGDIPNVILLLRCVCV